MPVSRPTYLQGEDIVFSVTVDEKYLDNFERLFAFVHIDDDHHLLTTTDADAIQMTPDVETSSVEIHISKNVTSNPDIMPVGTWKLEILSVDKDSHHWSIYQNLKQFELKTSYIIRSGDKYISKNIKR